MQTLTHQQVDTLRNHLILNGSDPFLLEELLDHLACEVEYYVWLGLPFEKAFEHVRHETNRQTVSQLNKVYYQELTSPSDNQPQADTLDDIVFENRNKAYGAYDLRQMYPKVMRNALFLTLGLFLMLMGLVGGVSKRDWSYSTRWGVMWIVGLCTTAYGGGNWYLQSIRQKYMIRE